MSASLDQTVRIWDFSGLCETFLSWTLDEIEVESVANDRKIFTLSPSNISLDSGIAARDGMKGRNQIRRKREKQKS